MGDTGANPIIPVDAKIKHVQTTSSSRSSNTGTRTFECIASVPNDTGKAMIYNFENTGGAKCGSVNFDFLTADWQETISATGNAQLTCHLTSQ